MNSYRSTSGPIKIGIITLTIYVYFTIFSLSAVAEKLSSLGKHFIKVSKSGQTISVDIINMDISDIAKMLSKETGIKVFLDESVSHKVTSKFRNIPLEPGIKRLLGPAVSSAFVFNKDNGPSGQVNYRIDTIKIFNSGNMLSANFKIFDSTVSETSGKKKDGKTLSRPKTSNPSSELWHQTPGTPGAIRHEIMQARKNLSMIREKSKVEAAYTGEKLARLRMKLSKRLSPDERVAIARELSQARQYIAARKSLNRRMIMDEEENLRKLVEEGTKTDSRKKFAERQRESERERNLRE